MAQTVKRLPTVGETQVQLLGQEALLEKGIATHSSILAPPPRKKKGGLKEIFLEKEMATHSSILAWRILWTEEPGRLQSTGSQRVGHN